MSTGTKLTIAMVACLSVLWLPWAWYLRGSIAKVVILGMQYHHDRDDEAALGYDPRPPRTYRGKVSYWYEDEYTEPNTRCFGVLMREMDCVAGYLHSDEPCEVRITKLCDVLYPFEP